MPPLLLLVFLLLRAEVWGFEAPEDKQDVFARKACPAFLTLVNAAYLSGVTVELPCHCKPAQVQSVVWFFRKHLGGSEEATVLTDHHGNKLLDPSGVPHSGDLQSRFSIRLFSLLIFRAGKHDSGVYICGSAHKDIFYGYDLDIQEAGTISFTARLSPKNLDERAKGRGTRGSAQPLYRTFSSFRPWSVCDRCGLQGEQVRVGLCYVQSKFLHVRYRRANQTVASCGSGAVPQAFGKVKNKRDGARLEVRSCQVTCPNPASPPSKIQSLMAFLGFGSPPAEIQLYYLNHPADRVLILGCPGARPTMAVAWDRDSEPIYRFKPSPGGNGSTDPRITIDTGHHLLFTPAKTQDSGVYHCWLQGRRSAEIHLLVYVHLGRRQSVTSHPDFPAALRTVLGSYAAMTAAFGSLLVCRAAVRLLRDQAGAHYD
ncbi:Ig-like V-type domain-containing protein FAM187A [Cheilinus undulatus]|uniref:Ig-like V-type domain-containing protein FAM187A n=1 Tax=Cheilinus undulatus TaxID=241271 RepID=UPI001BD2D0CA|nr:Ig-like V-type domain-containing protein FAM187A [Cheilinus undulatus]